VAAHGTADGLAFAIARWERALDAVGLGAPTNDDEEAGQLFIAHNTLTSHREWKAIDHCVSQLGPARERVHLERH
jgi:hypothetical protein